jgi:hypothetical protein
MRLAPRQGWRREEQHQRVDPSAEATTAAQGLINEVVGTAEQLRQARTVDTGHGLKFKRHQETPRLLAKLLATSLAVDG